MGNSVDKTKLEGKMGNWRTEKGDRSDLANPK